MSISGPSRRNPGVSRLLVTYIITSPETRYAVTNGSTQSKDNTHIDTLITS